MNLLNKMKLWQKLALMVAVLMVPTAYIVTLLIEEKNISINFTQKEMAGIEYLKPVYSLLLHVMEHRGMVYLQESGDTGINTRLDEKQQAINIDLERIAAVEIIHGISLNTSMRLTAVKNGWQNLKDQVQGLSREESFDQHTALIDAIAALITQVNDTSNLVLDQELDSSYLIDVTVTKMPSLLETMATLREKNAAVYLSAQTDEIQTDLSALVDSVQHQAIAIRHSMEVAFEYNPDITPLLAGSVSEFQRQISKFTDMVRMEIAKTGSTYRSESSDFAGSINAQDMYRAGNNAITSAINTIEQTIPVLNELLRTRIDNFNKKKYLALTNVVIFVFISIVIVFFITRYISQNVGGLVSIIKQFSKGNLIMELFENNDRDEISRLYNSLHDLQLKLTEVIRSIRVGTSEVSTASEQVAQGNANLSQRTQEQASSLEEVASSMEEMTGTVSQNADNAQQANQLAIGAREQADAGGVVVSRAMAAMSEINKSSKKIADIIGVIDEIAFQTNLLALNAAVEAARAGEQGRGFAVVASEVRNLAGRSATAAKEIKALIQDSVAKTQDGTKLVDESGHALSEIVQSVKKVSDIVAEIAAASREQSEGINQVNKALLQMDDMTQQNAALVEQAAAAAEAIDAQSQELEHQVQFFNIFHMENEPKSLGQGVHSISQDKTRLETGGKDRLTVAKAGQETKKVLPKLQTEDDGDWKEF
jgi:methyl-accepting chemotaxis protein